jgi:hypothetical protein
MADFLDLLSETMVAHPGLVEYLADGEYGWHFL